MPSPASISTLRAINAHNLQTFRSQPWSEISGSLGDLGTFLPIAIALSSSHQIDLSTTLIFTGVFNIATGFLFGIPLPVQPMKAIAAVAVLKGLSMGQVGAAGVFVAGCILVLSVNGLLAWVTRMVPIPVVKGIQVGAGLSLVIGAGTKMLGTLQWVGRNPYDNYFWAFGAFLALLFVNVSGRRVPYALVVTVLGLVFAVVAILTRYEHDAKLPAFSFWRPEVHVPKGDDWKIGILDAGVGQLPLTTLNSIVAVAHLAADLLPQIATPSVTSIGLSVAAMNLVSIWFGSMPVCHGSGGLAAQYKFGARSGASIIFLGLLKLLIGLVFGNSLQGLLKAFPVSLLSIMVIAAGFELASVGESLNTDRARDLLKAETMSGIDERERKRRWSTMLMTVGLLVGFKNDAIGFLAGILCHWSYVLHDRWNARNLSSHLRHDRADQHEHLLP